MTTKLATQVLRYVQVSSALSKRALDNLAQKQAGERQAAGMVPGLIDSLLKADAIGQDQKQAAAQMLGSHAQTMTLLKNAVAKIAELKQASTKQASELGAPAGDTEPSVSKPSPFVGRRTSEKSAADRVFFEKLGLPVS